MIAGRPMDCGLRLQLSDAAVKLAVEAQMEHEKQHR